MIDSDSGSAYGGLKKPLLKQRLKNEVSAVEKGAAEPRQLPAKLHEGELLCSAADFAAQGRNCRLE